MTTELKTVEQRAIEAAVTYGVSYAISDIMQKLSVAYAQVGHGGRGMLLDAFIEGMRDDLLADRIANEAIKHMKEDK